MTSRDSNPQLWVTSACSYVDCMLNVLNQETLIQPRYDNCNILWHNIFNKWSYKLVLNIISSKGQVSLALLLLVGGRGGGGSFPPTYIPVLGDWILVGMGPIPPLNYACVYFFVLNWHLGSFTEGCLILWGPPKMWGPWAAAHFAHA